MPKDEKTQTPVPLSDIKLTPSEEKIITPEFAKRAVDEAMEGIKAPPKKK